MRNIIFEIPDRVMRDETGFTFVPQTITANFDFAFAVFTEINLNLDILRFTETNQASEYRFALRWLVHNFLLGKVLFGK